MMFSGVSQCPAVSSQTATDSSTQSAPVSGWQAQKGSLVSIVLVQRTTHSFPKCPKPARESRLLKLLKFPSVSKSASGGDHEQQRCRFRLAVRCEKSYVKSYSTEMSHYVTKYDCRILTGNMLIMASQMSGSYSRILDNAMNGNHF